MAHVRQDTCVRPEEWAKHLRFFGKRVQAKAERQAAKKVIFESGEECLEMEVVDGLNSYS